MPVTVIAFGLTRVIERVDVCEAEIEAGMNPFDALRGPVTVRSAVAAVLFDGVSVLVTPPTGTV